MEYEVVFKFEFSHLLDDQTVTVYRDIRITLHSLDVLPDRIHYYESIPFFDLVSVNITPAVLPF